MEIIKNNWSMPTDQNPKEEEAQAESSSAPFVPKVSNAIVIYKATLAHTLNLNRFLAKSVGPGIIT